MPEKSILIVDDDPLVSKILTPFLVGHGYKVSSVDGGETALEEIKKARPDLIILDVQMPKMNGYSFLFELKDIPATNSIPIIVLTSKQGMAEIFKHEGVKEYLNKPIQTELLLSCIQKYI